MMALRFAALALLSIGSDGAFLSSRITMMKHHDRDYTEAKNVCMSVKESCARRLAGEDDDDTHKFMANKLNLQPMPKGYTGKVLPSALLVTRAKYAHLNKKNTAFQRKETEWSESMIPMFDFVSELREKLDKKGSDEHELFSAILLPQVPTAAYFMEKGSFDADVLDALMESSGSNGRTAKLFCEDIKKHVDPVHPLLCFNRLIHYRHGEQRQLKEKKHKHITSPKAAVALRNHVALSETRQSTGRHAVLAIQKDHKAWTNWLEVEHKMREKLEKNCWSMEVHDTGSSVQDTTNVLKDADLVVANHGVHNEHMIWMPRGAAFVEDKNCECSSYGYADLAKQEELRYMTTYGASDPAQCALEKKDLGVCAADKPRVVNFKKEILPTLELLIKDRGC